jgi:hypothetical protein
MAAALAAGPTDRTATRTFAWGSASPAVCGSLKHKIDLMAIVNGMTLLCEVKSSWRFRPVELTKMVALATYLRPDVALLP